MKALLLSAGYGTRLRPLTFSIPKCLIPIKGRPLLEIWLNALFNRNNIERVLINTHYMADEVVRFVAKSPWRNYVDLVYEEELLGTGGTLFSNREWFGSEPFLVAHADNLTNFDISELQTFHFSQRSSDIYMSMLAFRTETPESCGILEVDENNLLTGFHEKIKNPPGNLANAAVYILESSIFELLHHKLPFDLQTSIIPNLLGRIKVKETDAYFRDIGTLESLKLAETEYTSN